MTPAATDPACIDLPAACSFRDSSVLPQPVDHGGSTRMTSVRAPYAPSEHVEDNLQPSARLGEWLLGKRLGAGRISQVFEARPAGGRAHAPAAYAIKVLQSQWEQDPRAMALFRQEARLGRRISHPHIVPVLAAQVATPPFFVAMPRLAGCTLKHFVASSALPALPLCLGISRQVAQGLEQLLHSGGMMHGDVKPANIFVGPDGHAWLLDLGLCCESGRPKSLAERPVVGTLNYMAPEMLTSCLAADFRGDIYSLGVTLYEMLSGRLPFVSNTPGELAVLHRDAAAPSLAKLRPDLPGKVTALVHQMLAKEPMRRPQSYGELIDRLVRLEVATFSDRFATQRSAMSDATAAMSVAS